MRLLFVLFVGLMGLICATGAQAVIRIVPKPQHLTVEQGSFALRSGERIAAPKDARAQWIAQFLSRHVDAATGVKLDVVKAPASSAITLQIDPAITGRGAYDLQVTPTRITIRAADNRGLFWGVQTLRQLLPIARTASPTIPAVKIKDAPKYPWRGVMLDDVRHFYPVAAVEKQIALMSYYKFDVFHWHLTDSQGWRIQIKRYPKLTRVGAWHINPDGRRTGGFYTQQQIREVVKYARQRGVMVVPEIEMIGHSAAAIKAYPELSCATDPEATVWSAARDVECVGKASTFAFLDHVLDEVVKLFPSPYVHIGTDEVSAGAWDDCTACAALAKAHGIKDDEPDLHSYFVRKIQKFLASKGKTTVGWDEILEGGANPKAIVEVWHGPKFASQAMANGNRAIVAWPFYLNTPNRKMTLRDLYRNNPLNNPLFSNYQNKLLGGEAALWRDHTPYSPDAHLYPRLLAISEHLWNPAAHNWPNFLSRAQGQARWLTAHHVKYAPNNDDVADYRVSFNHTYRRWRIRALRGFNDIRMHYTLDGQEPTATSPAFTDVLDLYHPATVTVAPFRHGVEYQTPVTLHFVKDMALGDPVTSTIRPVQGHLYQMTDGILGSSHPYGTYDVVSPSWVVWPHSGMNVTVALKKRKRIHSIAIDFRGPRLPSSVKFEISPDNVHWTTLGTDHPVLGHDNYEVSSVCNVRRIVQGTKYAKYIRIVAKQDYPTKQMMYPQAARISAGEVIVK